jgi:Zn finger protein HypA/HybF involved in hydrogenase expression
MQIVLWRHIRLYMNLKGMIMENSKVKIKCYKCGNSYTTDMMRYDPDRAGRLACKECLSKKDQRTSTTYTNKPKEGDAVVKYYCIKCKYKFERRKSAPIASCPYCGGDTLTTKTDATSILKRAEEEDFER